MAEVKEKNDYQLLKKCDVVFMISGRFDPEKNFSLPIADSTNANDYIDVMENETIAVEIGENEKDKCDRYNLGDLKLKFVHDEKMLRQDDIEFTGFATLCVHIKTKLCVLEIYVPDCSDGVQALECERNDEMYIFQNGQYISEKEYLDNIRVVPHGLKRSVVFTYEDPTELECIGCIANEVSPHDGAVSGVLADRIRNGNFFQYEGARCYASSVTLLEIWKPENYGKLKDRFTLQTSEIYFIELILFRDASTQNISERLSNLQEDIKNLSIKEARKRLEKIDAAMANSLVLYDPSIIKWPTVRESVKLLSSYFEVNQIDDLYDRNKSIVDKMVDDLERKENKVRDDIMAVFLAIIALFEPIESLAHGIESVLSLDQFYLTAMKSFGIAIVLFFILFLIKNKKRK